MTTGSGSSESLKQQNLLRSTWMKLWGSVKKVLLWTTWKTQKVAQVRRLALQQPREKEGLPYSSPERKIKHWQGDAVGRGKAHLLHKHTLRQRRSAGVLADVIEKQNSHGCCITASQARPARRRRAGAALGIIVHAELGMSAASQAWFGMKATQHNTTEQNTTERSRARQNIPVQKRTEHSTTLGIAR